ncbi:hypothetical protein lerEdw1_017593 [Lerista edwardsae]|nr:hypothetical protein lerEdw1_017593 [Lerista edwardsae]
MAEMHMIEALKNLTENDFRMLQHRLNKKEIYGKTIPWDDIKETDYIKVTRALFAHHHPDHCAQVLINALNAIPRKDLAEKLRNQIEAEKKKSEDQIDETDGSPAKKQRLSGPEPYNGRYRLSDLEVYAAKNQEQLIKQLEDYLEPNGISTLKERLAHSKLKNPFMFNAKKCNELHNNQDLKEFRKKISSAQKSQNIPEKILATLFSTIKSKNKRRAVDQKQSKENSNSQLKYAQQERPGRENKPATSSTAGSPAESEPKNQWKGSTPASPNAIHLGLNDRDGEKMVPEPAHENVGVLQPSQIPGSAVVESWSCENDIVKGSTPTPPNAIFLGLNDREKMAPEPAHENVGVLQPSQIPGSAVEESQRYGSNVPKAEYSYDETIRKWCNKKVEICDFYYVGVREHKKYECFVVEDVIQFKLPRDTEYGLLRILQGKNDLTPAGKLMKNVKFELQFNMAVLGAPSSDVISPVSDFFEVVPFDHSFKEFEEFFKDVVCKIVLPVLALYKRVQADLLKKALDKQRDSYE